MFDSQQAIRKALEIHLYSIAIATTGAQTNISTSGAAYNRAAGSFVTDGFQVADTVYVTGFANTAANGYAMVTAVAALKLTVDRSLPTVAAGASVTINAVLPQARAFPGQEFTIPTDKPWIRATTRVSGQPLIGAGGSLPYFRHIGIFIVDCFYPYQDGYGRERIERIAAGVRDGYKVTTALPYGGIVVRISGMQPGSLLEDEGFLHIPVTPEYAADSIGV